MYILYKNRYFNFIYFNLFEKKINNDSQVFSNQICDRHNDHFMVLCFIVPTVYSNLNHIFSCVFVSTIYQVLRVVYISNNCNKKKKQKQKQNNKKHKQKRKQKQTQNKTKRIKTKQNNFYFNLTFDLKLLIYRSRNKLRRLYINDWYCDYYIIVYEMNTLGSSEQGQQFQPQSLYHKSHQQSKAIIRAAG